MTNILLIFFLLILNNSIEEKWILDAATIANCPGSAETFSFNGYDQNCQYVNDVYVCKELLWDFVSDSRLRIYEIDRVPEQDTSYEFIRYSNYTITETKITSCDTFDQNCVILDYTLVNDTLRVFDVNDCDAELTFIQASSVSY